MPENNEEWLAQIPGAQGDVFRKSGQPKDVKFFVT